MADQPPSEKRLNQALMKRIREEGRLPSSVEMIVEAFTRMGYSAAGLTPEAVLQRFDEQLRAVFVGALPVLEAHEERTYAAGIASALMGEYPDLMRAAEEVADRDGFPAGVLHLM